MATRKDKMIKFSKLNLVKAMEAIRCGFELETQAVDGYSYDEIVGDNDGEYDEVAIQEAIDERLSELEESYLENREEVLNSQGHLLSLFECMIAAHLEFLQEVYPQLNISKENLDDYLRYGLGGGGLGRHVFSLFKPDTQISAVNLMPLINEIASVIAAAKGNTLSIALGRNGIRYLRMVIRDNLDMNDFYTESECGTKSEIESIGLEIEHDGSVDGPEIKSGSGGVTSKEFLGTLKTLLDRHTIEVDEGCSFHIHLSIPGIQHTYGPALQREIYSYLLNNMDKVPESVKKRWKSEKLNEYFSPQISTGKYSFVHFHRDYGTWEFRAFGNISNYKDGRACLALAVKALQHAYKVNMGLAKSLWTGNETNDSMYDVFLYSAQKGIKLKDAIKIAKENGKLREAA